jgi:MFS family permease
VRRHGGRTSWRARVTGLLPPGRASRRFLGIALIDSVGTGLFLAGSALFFIRVLELSTVQVGIALSLSGMAGLLFSVPLGRFADRVGGRRVLLALYLYRGLGFLGYLVVHDFTTVLLVACLLGVGERATGPVVQALVGAMDEAESRVRTMAAVNAVRNIGFSIGTLLATAAIAAHSPTAFRGLVLANAVSFFLAALLLTRTPAPVTRPARRSTPRPYVRVQDPRYLLLTALNSIIVLHTVVLSVGLPLWIVTRTDAPAVLVGAVMTVNTVLAIVLGMCLGRGSEGIPAAATRQNRAGWCLAACCLLVAPTGHVHAVGASLLLLAAALPLTLGEVWQSLGGWGLSYALSPEHQRNYYLSVYGLGPAVATVVGPAVLTTAVLGGGPVGWLGLGGVFAAAGLAVRAVARTADHQDRSPL